MQEARDERDAARARWSGLIEELDARADRAEETLSFVRVERDNAQAEVERLTGMLATLGFCPKDGESLPCMTCGAGL